MNLIRLLKGPSLVEYFRLCCSNTLEAMLQDLTPAFSVTGNEMVGDMIDAATAVVNERGGEVKTLVAGDETVAVVRWEELEAPWI